mmetsp:Transcript_28183/g.41628  ORF Transcript_28183/g.41628 Transcript_28183/m.41628 type:complete len:427 (-) Transcript_28183:52-1332(-)|eukprot:CAMPEP_0194226786 /NCGR_PEP_ID=MMETSP0156-20130528/42517_1 /TAXON_ID=33649 /ORGANISM="Thalassionema nitzschioides, Strain L26-B" /LENGTH=426 /DNA_ID=CAMNT_0038959243 /DNA_START=90 /DNA_END=1370 /DNA_ORIENTATION=+
MATNQVGSLEIEPLSHEEYEEDKRPQIPMMRPMGFFENFYNLTVAYASYYRHITAAIVACLTVITVIIVLESIAKLSTKSHNAMSSITHDYTNTNDHSFFNLKMKDVDHWCLSGGNDDCSCDDPTDPMSKIESKAWRKAFRYNHKIVKDEENYVASHVDVVFLGDQAIEAFNGNFMGESVDELRSVSKTFKKNFGTQNGTDLNGLALGIGGDSISNLLWRLQHGEMPESLNPSVWWIAIGGNDLAEGQCSEEAVVLGTLRLAEYVLEKKPDSFVVINSILPSHKLIKPRTKRGEKHSQSFQPFDLWSSIAVVNDQLEKFCAKHSSFSYFDSSGIFFVQKPKSISEIKAEMKESGKKKFQFRLQPLKSNLIDSQGRVKVAGHKAWLNAIVPELKRIMVEEIYDQMEGLEFFDDQLVDDFYDYSDDYQ